MALAHQATAATLWAVSLSSERDDRSIASHVLGDPKQRNNLIALGIAPTTQSQQSTYYRWRRFLAFVPRRARGGSKGSDESLVSRIS